MKFSVIIPVFNSERTLERCIRSLTSQTFTDFEAIFINDGSTDCSERICLDFTRKYHWFRYIKQDNLGVSKARNRGLQEARGDFVVFLDSDDQYCHDYLENFNRIITSYPKFDHYWCGFQPIDEMGKPIGPNICYSIEQEITLTDRSSILDLHELWMDSTIWNKAYRRDLLNRNHIRMDEELSLGEDLLFNYQYLDCGREGIVVNNSPLYQYTKSQNGSLDSKYREDLQFIYEKLDTEVLKYLQKWKISSEKMRKYYNSVFYMQEKILRNTYRPESSMTNCEKYRYNKTILQSEKFQTALKESDCFIHPAYRLSYRLKAWWLVLVLNTAVSIKKRIYN